MYKVVLLMSDMSQPATDRLDEESGGISPSLGFLDNLKKTLQHRRACFLHQQKWGCPVLHNISSSNDMFDRLHIHRHTVLCAHTHHSCSRFRRDLQLLADYILLDVSTLAVIHFNKALHADIMLMKVETLGWCSWTHTRDLITSRWRSQVMRSKTPCDLGPVTVWSGHHNRCSYQHPFHYWMAYYSI